MYSNRRIPPCIRTRSLQAFFSRWKSKMVMGIVVEPEKKKKSQYADKENKKSPCGGRGISGIANAKN
jgi:hypothetical protein